MAQIRKRVLKSGKVSYEVRLHRAGHGEWSKSFEKLADARQWEKEEEASVNRGEYVDQRKKKDTIGQVLSEFAAEYKDRKGHKIGEQERRRLQFLNLDLEKFSVNALDNGMITRYLEGLKDLPIPVNKNRKKIHPLYNGAVTKTYAPSTVRKFYYQLKKCLEWHALKNGYQLDPHLFKSQPVPSSWGGQRERRLNGDEESKLLAAAGAGYKFHIESQNIILFAIETAMRSQEILKARWCDLNVDGRTLNIPKEHVKTKTFRQVPLSKKALSIIEDMKRFREDLGSIEPKGDACIFWQWKDSDHLARHFRRICHRGGLKDLHFHDLRHEATSRFFEKGRLSDMEIMKITGHTQYSTLQRYVQLRPSVLADKMD